MKILVADDSKTFLGLICASLQRLGHDVIPASKGKDAIELYKSRHPDLVILDVMMAEMDGFECARIIRSINPEDWIPIIFLSATVDDESIAKGIEAGGDDYLTKPYSEITLEAKIKAMQRIAEMRNRLFATMEELRKLTSRDVLTGLYNRFQFELTLKEKIAEANRYQCKLALLFIDLDHFKSINDSLGHSFGDMLLREVAVRIRRITREDDFVARIGGDEFVIIVHRVENMNHAGELAQKLVNELSREYQIADNNFKISASIGIAIYPDVSVDEASITRCADIAMYTAKRLGRSNFQYYTEVLGEQYKKQQGIEYDLKYAIERNEMIVVYQPIYELLTKKVVKVEALVRWKHPDFGYVSPNIFIPVAEDMGIMPEIGMWVLKEVCNNTAHLVSDAHSKIKIAVNVSIRQFIQDNFVDMILDVLNDTHFPANKLVLEITETTVISYSSSFKNSIGRLHEQGIEITIDDFGVKNTSLRSLKYLPISTLKIDKNFIKNVDANKKNCIIVRTLIALGESLSLQVIAEGVQTEEQLQFLIANNCRYGQGFLLSKPLSREQITALIEAENKAVKMN